MKFAKYLLVACSALLFAACSNDDWNTNSDVTVEMAQASIKTKENVGVFYVPLKVTGTTNGPIKVKVEVEEVAASPAIENVHYLVTSKSVTIPADSVEVGIEIVAENDMDLNDDRMFVISIVEADGAKIGSQKSCDVIIRDDDGLFYEAIQGTWTLSEYSIFDDSPESFTMRVTGILDEESPDYEKLLYFSGWGEDMDLTAEAEYSIDANNEITIYIPYGQVIGGPYNFSAPVGVASIYFYGLSGNSILTSGGVYGTVSADLKTITFDPYAEILLGLNNSSGFTGYGYGGGYEMVMTR